METLVRSLRNLGLAAPNGEQITSLVDADPQVEKRLAQQLAVPAQIDLMDSEDASAAMVDAALLTGATEAMLANYNRTLQQQVEALKEEFVKTNSPKPIKRIPLRALLSQQEALIRRRTEERLSSTSKSGSTYIPRQILDTDFVHCSTKAVSDLQRLDFDELLAPKRFEGRYLVVRVVSRLSVYASCSFVGEILPSGAPIPISIAYFTPNLNLYGEELDAMLPVGTYLLIREPYISTHYLGFGGPITGAKDTIGIRIDTPSDVIVLDDNDALLADLCTGESRDDSLSTLAQFAEWRQEGPLTRAIQRSFTQNNQQSSVPPVTATLTSTRDIIRRFLRQERPGAAWREWLSAEKLGLWNTETDSSAVADDLLLKVDVLVELSDFAEADTVLETVPLEERDQAWTCYKAEVSEALYVSSHGPSEGLLQRIFQTTFTDPSPRFRLGEFHGPIEVQQIPNAGRGLVLTRDVSQGELLLCCRALGSTYSTDKECDGVPLLRVNIDSGVTSTTTQVLAATRCIHGILDRPELATAILGLTAGPDIPNSEYVAKPYPLKTLRLSGDAAIQSGMHSPDVDALYVNGVLRFNAFGPAATPAAATGNDPMSRSTMPHPLPAILNHACLPNVSSVFFGDLVTTRALHPLPAGTQIMHQYVQGELPYDSRQSLLSKHGFQCSCGLCELDEHDGASARHQRKSLLATSLPPLVDRSQALLQNMQLAAIDAHQDMVTALQELVSNLDATYNPARTPLRPDLADIFLRASKHAEVYDKDAALRLARAGTQATGAVLSDDTITRLPDLYWDGAIQCLLMLAKLHEEDKVQQESWIQAAIDTHHSMIGGGTVLFLQRYSPELYPVLRRLADSTAIPV
ncbi:hypothetical protein MYAM1_000497 [Malassezia yamatoensis]|uniref:SET domain-containing protein n=1 Tax=Malassezia yamatoensis TaxID=253288 RepID=A0AAJ5YR92_9BASI|nr:hypothetical protein MYAM1_000497 [Malassezia yamatoensis]